MKYFPLKSRRGQRAVPRVSLFPFLAVLICTMGALVIVLFVVMRQARIHALEAATAKAAKAHAEKRASQAKARTLAGKLQEARNRTVADLALAQSHLDEVQAEANRLRDRTRHAAHCGQQTKGRGKGLATTPGRGPDGTAAHRGATR